MNLYKNINSSLLALACGDSYGSYFERDGLYGVTFDIKKLPSKPVEPMITDDTKMANILLKHYEINRKLMLAELLKRYKKWAITDGQKDGIGIHTYKVLVENQKDKDSQGNGALMRVIPFGLKLITDGYSFDDALKMMNNDSALTHKNETIFIANKLSLDLAINGIDILDKSIYKDILSEIHLGDTAWVINSLYIVIEALKRDFTFLEGFKYIVAAGGDTDTNCAIYGAIKGYKEDISKEVWISDFLTKWVQKSLVS